MERVSVQTLDPCMTADLLVTRIVHWLRRDQVDARIAVRVLDRSQQLSFEILFQDNTVAERTFDVLPRDCAARRDAFALAVSLALDNVVQRREQIAAEIAAAATVVPTTGELNATGEGGSASAPESEADTRAVSGPAPDVRTAREPPLQLGLALGVSAFVHGLPGLSALGEAAIELTAGAVMGRLGVLASTPANTDLVGGAVATRLLGGRADLCVTHSLSAFGVIGCAGLQAGAVHMAGRGFTRSDTSVQAWVAGAGRFALEWPRDLFRMRVFVEGWIPLLSPAAQVTDPDGTTLGKVTTVRVGVILGFSALVVFR